MGCVVKIEHAFICFGKLEHQFVAAHAFGFFEQNRKLTFSHFAGIYSTNDPLLTFRENVAIWIVVWFVFFVMDEPGLTHIFHLAFSPPLYSGVRQKSPTQRPVFKHNADYAEIPHLFTFLGCK